MPYITSNGDLNGECPQCHSVGNGFRNYGKHNWVTCERCRVGWYVGYNLFSTWKQETKEDWERNGEYLSGFKLIDHQTLELIDHQTLIQRFIAPLYGTITVKSNNACVRERCCFCKELVETEKLPIGPWPMLGSGRVTCLKCANRGGFEVDPAILALWQRQQAGEDIGYELGEDAIYLQEVDGARVLALRPEPPSPAHPWMESFINSIRRRLRRMKHDDGLPF
jgi:hypothetical protein